MLHISISPSLKASLFIIIVRFLYVTLFVCSHFFLQQSQHSWQRCDRGTNAVQLFACYSEEVQWYTLPSILTIYIGNWPKQITKLLFSSLSLSHTPADPHRYAFILFEQLDGEIEVDDFPMGVTEYGQRKGNTYSFKTWLYFPLKPSPSSSSLNA